MNRDDDRLRERMRRDPASEPLRDMWPAVRSGLERRGSSRRQWGVALRTSAFAMAGILIGLYLGAVQPSGSDREDLYTSLGSTLPADGPSSLAEQYLENLSSEGDLTP